MKKPRLKPTRPSKKSGRMATLLITNIMRILPDIKLFQTQL